MKKIFKYVILMVACFGCIFIYDAILSPSIVSINKNDNGTYDTYVVKYSNGKTESIIIKNGEDGKDLTIEDLYIATKTAKGYGDDYTLLDFIEEYTNFTVEEKDETKAYLGALSTVSLYCEFPTNISYSTGSQGYGLSMGAGVIYQPDGVTDEYYIITNYHVVYNSSSKTTDKIASKFTCFLYGANVDVQTTQLSFGGYSITYGDDAINCSYVGGSMENDIAVLKVTDKSKILSSNARPATICTTDPVVGETVVAIGNPEGMGTSVTKGIVSVDSEYMQTTASDNSTQIIYRAIRTDAPINSGNSGGGLFNAKGELIGIVNSKLATTEIEGMAFALPITPSVRLANVLIENEGVSTTASKPVLGLTIKIASSKAEYEATTKNIKIVEEVEVDVIADDSICKDLLCVGDKFVSVKIDGVDYKIDRQYKLRELTWLMKKDHVVIFKVIRSGAETDVAVVVNASCFTNVA